MRCALIRLGPAKAAQVVFVASSADETSRAAMSEGEERETCYTRVKVLWIFLFVFFSLKAIHPHSEVIKCTLLKYNSVKQEKNLLMDAFQICSERTE